MNEQFPNLCCDSCGREVSWQKVRVHWSYAEDCKTVKRLNIYDEVCANNVSEDWFEASSGSCWGLWDQEGREWALELLYTFFSGHGHAAIITKAHADKILLLVVHMLKLQRVPRPHVFRGFGMQKEKAD